MSFGTSERSLEIEKNEICEKKRKKDEIAYSSERACSRNDEIEVDDDWVRAAESAKKSTNVFFTIWIREVMILIRTNFMNRSLISSIILRANFFQSIFKIFFRIRISIDRSVNFSFMMSVICRRHQLNFRFFVKNISCLITFRLRF